jgi:hypothetical protein
VLSLRDKYGKKGNLKGFFKENRCGMEAGRDEVIPIMDAVKETIEGRDLFLRQ